VARAECAGWLKESKEKEEKKEMKPTVTRTHFVMRGEEDKEDDTEEKPKGRIGSAAWSSGISRLRNQGDPHRKRKNTEEKLAKKTWHQTGKE